MATLHVLVVQTFEQATPGFAIVEHRFRGRTQQDAWGVYQSHLKADQFIRECMQKGLYAGRVQCRNEMHWETEDVPRLPTRQGGGGGNYGGGNYGGGGGYGGGY